VHLSCIGIPSIGQLLEKVSINSEMSGGRRGQLGRDSTQIEHTALHGLLAGHVILQIPAVLEVKPLAVQLEGSDGLAPGGRLQQGEKLLGQGLDLEEGWQEGLAGVDQRQVGLLEGTLEPGQVLEVDLFLDHQLHYILHYNGQSKSPALVPHVLLAFGLCAFLKIPVYLSAGGVVD
jgi:hypothetical protein